MRFQKKKIKKIQKLYFVEISNIILVIFCMENKIN